MDATKLYDISGYRYRIDSIDRQIYKLLEQRMKVMHKVKLIKQKHVKRGSTIRAARGMEVIHNACDYLVPLYPKQVIASIWRNFIAISEYNEQKFSILSFNECCYWLAREFFTNYIDNQVEKDIKKFMSYLHKNDSHFGFLPFPGENISTKWWVYLIKSDIKVFAIAPLLADSQKRALLVGHVMLEPSVENNFTLFATQHLEKVTCKYTILDIGKSLSGKMTYLIEVENFYEQLEHCDLIGNYAVISTV